MASPLTVVASERPARRDYREPEIAARYQRVSEAVDAQANVAGQVATQAQRIGVLADVRHILAITSGKGGVGKSTLAANLAVACARRGLRTGLLDADPHGSEVTRLLGLHRPGGMSADGLTPAVGVCDLRVMSLDLFIPREDGESGTALFGDPLLWLGMREDNALLGFLTNTQWGELDVLLVDLPPGPLALARLLEVVPELSGTVCVAAPATMRHQALRRVVSVLQERMAVQLGLIVNQAGMVCATCGAYNAQYPDEALKHAAAALGLDLLGAVPFDPAITQCMQEDTAYMQACWDAPAAREIRRIAALIADGLPWP